MYDFVGTILVARLKVLLMVAFLSEEVSLAVQNLVL